MLQEYAEKLSATKLNRATTIQDPGWGGISEFRELATPWEANVNGTDVMVIGIADQRGSSPVELCCEANGEQAFLTIKQVRITDRRLLPRHNGPTATGTTTTRGRGRHQRTTNTTATT